MADSNPAAAPAADPDPEVEALLDFIPVARRNKRHDGWPPERQRGFVAALARLGNVDRAAHSVGRTASGAWKVRTSAGAEEFADAWDEALALYHLRNPRLPRAGRPSRGELRADPGRAWPRDAAPAAAPPVDPEAERRASEEAFDDILTRYWLKVGQEREARLAGHIATADFYVRQLTCIEIALDVGGAAHKLLAELKRGGCATLEIAATPMSVLLDKLRRDIWREAGEPDRPPLSPLGDHDEEVATGIPTYFSSDRDGDYQDWRHRQDEAAALAAEAQRAWEEKARADAAEWRSTESKTNDG